MSARKSPHAPTDGQLADQLADVRARAYRAARRVGLSHAEAEDFAQETAYQALLLRNAGVPVDALIRRLLSRALDHRRKLYRHKMVPIDLSSVPARPEQPEPAHTADQVYAVLSDGQKPYWPALTREKTADELADELGTSRATVFRRLRAMRADIRAALGLESV